MLVLLLPLYLAVLSVALVCHALTDTKCDHVCLRSAHFNHLIHVTLFRRQVHVRAQGERVRRVEQLVSRNERDNTTREVREGTRSGIVCVQGTYSRDFSTFEVLPNTWLSCTLCACVCACLYTCVPE